MGKRSRRLNLRQQVFCREYMRDFNGTRAYKAAGFNVTSDGSAAANASRLLKDDNVKAYMEELRQEFFMNAEITTEQIIAQYKKLAFNDARSLYNEQGELKDPKDWPDEIAAAVVSFEVAVDEDGNVIKKVKLIDRKGSLDSLSRINGLFKDKVEMSGKLTLEQLVEASMKPEAGEQ